MAWVRYDDGFHDHDKVAQLRVECPEALALHLLANTWTSRSKRPGYVPEYVPPMLVGKAKAGRWVPRLVAAELWTVTDGGWEFANHEKYRAPVGRQTPGTPEDLSAKRAAAGRAGGRSTASKRTATAPANGAANAATVSSNGKQASSKPCSPVVASNEATPEPEPPTGYAAPPALPGLALVEPPRDTPLAQQVVAAYFEGAKTAGQPMPAGTLAARVGKQAKAMLATTELAVLVEAARGCGAGGWTDLATQVQRDAAARRPKFGISYTDADRGRPTEVLTSDEWQARSAR